MDLGEVPSLVAVVQANSWRAGRADAPWAQGLDVADLFAAVRSLVERARREGREEAAVEVSRWHGDLPLTERGWLLNPIKGLMRRIRALTPAVPGAADEEG